MFLVQIRFSRHARNKVRLYKLTPAEVEVVVRLGDNMDCGEKRESRIGNLRVIWLMVGDYALVVTVIRAGRG